MNAIRSPGAPVRLCDLVSALSYGLDLAEGQRRGHAMRSCLIGMRLGEALHLNPDTRAALYYALLLKDAGGSSTATALADLFGCDDHAIKQDLRVSEWTRRWAFARVAVRNAMPGRALRVRLWRALKIAADGPQGVREIVRTRGAHGAAVVGRLGVPEEAAEGICDLDEQWDGRGHPDGKRGEAISLLARIGLLAQTVDALHVSRDLDTAFRMVHRQRRTRFDPGLVDALWAWRDDREWWHGLLRDDLAKAIAAAEPRERIRYVDERGIDTLAEAFAEIIDAKTPFAHGNSGEIARLAGAIARKCGTGPATQRRIYRAALLHDIGNLGVSSRILTKTGPLSPDEHKAIERHTVYTWEILSRGGPLRDVASTAALHHERLDGSGYPNGLDHKRLDLPARILAVADVYVALINRRPYRPALPPEVALGLLRSEADDGRFDADVVRALSRSLLETPSPSLTAT